MFTWVPRFCRVRFIFLTNGRRHSVARKYRCLLIVLVMLLSCLVTLHTLILPAVNGGYNDDCYLSDKKLATLRTLVQNISRTFEHHNVTYWLDYGTLLGALKKEDILPWDHDADISFILNTDSSMVYEDLLASGIHANGLIARYGSISVDFARWRPTNNSAHSEVFLEKYYPESIMAKENPIVKYHHKLKTFPSFWVVPTRKVNFQGVTVAVPRYPERLLAHRYPFTYRTGLHIPYKWKCWTPCWLWKDARC